MTVDEQTDLRSEWTSLVTQVCDDVEAWCLDRNWWVHRDTKTLAEESLGEYDVPCLAILTPQVRLEIDPVGVEIVGAQGRIDIVVYPTMNSMLLLRRKDRWQLYTDSRVPWPVDWSQSGFYGLVEALAAP